MVKIKITKHFLKKLILPTIIFVQFMLIAVLAIYCYWTRLQVNTEAISPPLKISQLIVKSVESVTSAVPTDAKTGRVYIHQAKITLPPPPDRPYELYYNYVPAYTGSQPLLNLIDKQNVDMQKGMVYASSDVNDVFNHVPKLQACSRGYQLFLSPATKSDTDGKLVFSKKLQDGRTAYVYLEDMCSDNKDQMIPYLKQMNSY